jgi:hypothetical protein
MEIFIVIALVFICYKLQGIYNVLFNIHRDMIKYNTNKND